MLINHKMPNIASSKKGINPQIQINKQKRILFIISLLVLATVFGSCSSSRKAKKKCRECPEFSMNHVQEKAS